MRNAYYSHSKVRTWRRCHKLFDYKYEQGLIRKTAPAALLRGVTYHEMLDAKVMGKDPMEALVAYTKIYNELWDEEKEKYPSPEELTSLYHRYVEHYRDDTLNYNGRSEIEVTAEYQGIKFLGIIDKVPEDEAGRVWVMDHKCLDSNHWVEAQRGKIRMGDLTTEDQVISSDGDFIDILEVVHQSLPGYEIKLVGGKVLRATAEHRWPVIAGARSDRLLHRMVDTQTLMDYPRIYLKPSRPINSWLNSNFRLDPYVMGAILGDGGLTQSVRFCCPEDDILQEVSKRLPSGCSVKLWSKPPKAPSYGISGLKKIFQSYGLFGKRSYEKHIPEEYFQGSIPQRMDLLQGLMDTDGSVYKNSTYLYVTTSDQLMLDVQRLVTGLGGIPLVRSPKANHYQGGKLGRKSYQVKFTLPESVGIPFKLPRKISSILGGAKRSFGSNLRVLSVTPIGDIPVTDITVDSEDHLFSVEGILTHNTHKVIPDENNRFSDLQTVLYWWALREQGEETDGVLWDYIRTKPPAVVEVLKKGGLTRRVNLDSDYTTYMKAIIDNELDPADYQEELNRVKGNIFFKRVYLPRPAEELIQGVVGEFFTTAQEIENSTSKVRNMTRDCSSCSYFQLCQAELRGLDGSFIKKQMFTVRETKPLE